MPACRLKALTLRKNGLIERPITLGEHLRNRRLVLGLRQQDVARRLNTQREVYERWERDERVPVVSVWPGIIRFLGRYPFALLSDADLVLMARRVQGTSQKTLAGRVGVIHQTLRAWERGSDDIVPRFRARISALAESS